MRKKIKEQIEYDGPERMDPTVQSKIERGETPLSTSPGFPEQEEGQSKFEEIIASKRFKDVVDKVKMYTGIQDISGPNTFSRLTSLLMNAVYKIKEIENGNEEYLENLAVDLIKKEMGLPDNAFIFDVELMSGMGQISSEKMNKVSKEPTEEEVEQAFGEDIEDIEEDLENFMAAFESFDMEKAKRRFINSLIQGASKKGHYMFTLVEEELNRISPDLLNLYGVLMSVNDLLYWIMPEETIMRASASGDGVQGSEEVIPDPDDPEDGTATIKVKGLFFPVLIHELLKGVYEALGTAGLPDDPKQAEMVMSSQDTLPYEVWDLRLGPVIWEKFLDTYPDKIFAEDMKEIQNYLFSKISALSSEQFFELARQILSGSQDGKKALNAMVDEIIQQIEKEDYDEAMYRRELDVDDFDLDDFLDGLGIGAPDDED